MTDPRDTTVTHVSPALRYLVDWLEAQPRPDRDRLAWSDDVVRAFGAGYEAGVRDTEKGAHNER